MKVEIGIKLWYYLVKELKYKGKGYRESGAFLLGENNYKISDFICYDELDKNCLYQGAINFSSSGYVRLWDYCRNKNLQVIADVHTHPGNYTNQSIIDSANPMIPQIGHIALIIPCFAQKRIQLLNGVGVFEYLGNNKWNSFKKPSNKIKITLYG